MKQPKYKTLREFIDAKTAGLVPKKCRVVMWSSTGAVTIDGPRGQRFYEANSFYEFTYDFAAAMGLEGFTA